MKQWYRLKVIEVVRETPDAITIRFAQPSSGRIWYYAGQFVTLKVTVDEKIYYRTYSISTSPQLDEVLAITVKRLPGGVVSTFLNSQLKSGMQLDVMQPMGTFYLENSVKNRRHIVLIGAGSGITPLMSILRSTLFNEPHSHVSLVYGNRDEEQIIFCKDLEVLQEKFPDRFQVTHFLSHPIAPTKPDYVKGRITALWIRDKLPEWGRGNWEEVRFFICGPEAMMQSAQQILQEAGVPDALVHCEYFTAEQASLSEVELEGLESRDIQLEIGGTIHELTVPAGTVILDAAMDAGLPVLYSCRRGVCATCVGKLSSGEVKMKFNEGLPDWDVQQGYMLMCQAFPLTDDVNIQAGDA